MSVYKLVPFNVLLGKTLTKCEHDLSNDSLTIEAEDGSIYKMKHDQACCEDVYIEDITGDLGDLIGSRIVRAEERHSSDDPWPVKYNSQHKPESYTWTYYELATNKGSVTIRWFGESNGYYSETAELYEVEKAQ